jgi:hypothetical protein
MNILIGKQDIRLEWINFVLYLVKYLCKWISEYTSFNNI